MDWGVSPLEPGYIDAGYTVQRQVSDGDVQRYTPDGHLQRLVGMNHLQAVSTDGANQYRSDPLYTRTRVLRDRHERTAVEGGRTDGHQTGCRSRHESVVGSSRCGSAPRSARTPAWYSIAFSWNTVGE